MAAIDHLFVLMLENRSFDHFYGLSGQGPGHLDPRFGPGASDRAKFDPPHEFANVQAQIAGGAMTGFSSDAMLGFLPGQVPVVQSLARDYVLFDNWFSAMPGPTWPNRFFVHAASSGGLADSPSAARCFGAVTLPRAEFRFHNGSIFNRIDSHGLPWRVYHGDMMPQVLACAGMIGRYLKGDGTFRRFHPDGIHEPGFAADVSNASYAPAYTFIEPNYSIRLFGSFRNGDSQHPRGLVSAGDALILETYNALRSSPIWDRSALLVVWDEHGGFYDHVPPPRATPPGDPPMNETASNVRFRFDSLGVRVPALLVSPRAPQGVLGSQLFPGQNFDHSAVVAALIDNFGLGRSITARDAASQNFLACLTATAENVTSTYDSKSLSSEVVPTPPTTSPASDPDQLAPTGGDDDVQWRHVQTSGEGGERDGFLQGVALIALDLDRNVARLTQRNMLAHPERRRELATTDQLGLAEYVEEVAVRVSAYLTRLIQTK